MDLLRLEPQSAPVEVGGDRLVLLRDERQEVGAFVAVEVRHGHMDRSRPRIDRVADEDRVLPLPGPVLQQEHAAHLAPAELGHHEIEVAVAVEIGGLDVGHAPEAFLQDILAEARAAETTKPDDAAPRVVARRGGPQISDQQIAPPVPVEIDDFCVRGVRHLGEDVQGGVVAVGVPDQHQAVEHVADDQLQPGVVDQVDQTDVRHRVRPGRARRREGVHPGSQLATVQVGAARVQGEALRGALLEPGDELVGRQLLGEIEQPVHVAHVRGPGPARLHLRLREEMTGRAPLAQHGFVELRSLHGALRRRRRLARDASEDGPAESREGRGEAGGGHNSRERARATV
ncbi:MAG: hypothetical protein AUH92_06445 [Acidobacteria bacterium 13_1_40CM_4_69_4]|nr:MAG: hypothetical protein AUH92_06445 [Acidobacteria bacterium 13_1_40CM_4_69_4]